MRVYKLLRRILILIILIYGLLFILTHKSVHTQIRVREQDSSHLCCSQHKLNSSPGVRHETLNGIHLRQRFEHDGPQLPIRVFDVLLDALDTAQLNVSRLKSNSDEHIPGPAQLNVSRLKSNSDKHIPGPESVPQR